jgi:integral membrane protein (TIGR01906 family)
VAGITQTVQERKKLPTIVQTTLALLFVLAIPLVLITTNVRLVTLSRDTYDSGFAKYRASQRTGLSPDQLSQVANDFIAYFQAPPGILNPVITLRGERRLLFNDREVAHMEDVQKLMQLVFRVGQAAALFLLIFLAIFVLWQRDAGFVALGRLALWGSGLTILLLVIVAGLSFFDFSELFTRVHELSFQNDLWILDPRTDYLLMLFPEGFWLDVTLRIAMLTAAEAAVIGAVGLFLSHR